MQYQANIFFHTLHFTLHTCTSHSTTHLISNYLISFRLMSPHLTSSHLIPSLLTYHLRKFFSTIFMLSEHWTKFISIHFSCISAALHARNLLPTKLAQSISQYYFVLQNLHKKHFPLLLCITKLAQSTSQYYFVFESLHNVLPSTTSYYKSCTKYFPVLLRTTKLAQKALPSTTLYYKVCTKYFPVLLRTTKLAQSTSQYYFVLQSLYEALPSTTS